ncbi:MAG: hypothetical protein JNK12_05215 [Acidimicrobiales bacterium]|nr:hypothetical protein [Acidimicrobiales bacterium]
MTNASTTDAPEDVDEHDHDHDHDDEPRDPEEQVRRLERLRVCLLAVDQAAVRRALKGLPAPVLDSVAKAVRVRPPVLRAGSPNVLRRLHDPLLLDTVASAVSSDCIDTIRERLGDEADDPSAEAVLETVNAITDTEYPLAMVRLTLAMVAAGGAEASEVCNDLLDTDERFATPDEAELESAPVLAVAPTPTARVADADKKAARKARKAEEAERKRLQAEKKAAADAKRKAEQKAAAAGPVRAADEEDEDDRTVSAVVSTAGTGLVTPTPPAPAPAAPAAPAPKAAPLGAPPGARPLGAPPGARPVGPPPGARPVSTGAGTASRAPVARRRAALTGDDARDFDVDDAYVGSIVIAEIWFDNEESGGMEAKRRPCVVVGVNDREFLVRPGYSEGGRRARDWQSHEVGDWREAGLDGLTYIEAETRRIDKAQADLPPIGKLTILDWNALW